MIVPVTHVTMAFAKMASIAMTVFANLASLVSHTLKVWPQIYDEKSTLIENVDKHTLIISNISPARSQV